MVKHRQPRAKCNIGEEIPDSGGAYTCHANTLRTAQGFLVQGVSSSVLYHEKIADEDRAGMDVSA